MPRPRVWKMRIKGTLARCFGIRPHVIGLVMAVAVPALGEPSAPAAPQRTGVAAGSEGPVVAGARLPRQFTVELTRDGAIFADGARVRTIEDIEDRARRAIAAPTFFAGAAVFSELPDEARLAGVSAALKRAGFATVRSVGRAAPPELSAAAPAPGSAPSVAKVPAVPPPAAAPPALAREPRKVEVLTVGLHVARPLGLEPHRSRLLNAFEKQFGAFERCHALASAHAQNASFGVDLLVPARGGRGAVRQTRTRLTGEAFHSCMARTFEGVVFPPPPTARPEMVSYSLLFKPLAR
jgi:hypothetical protein